MTDDSRAINLPEDLRRRSWLVATYSGRLVKARDSERGLVEGRLSVLTADPDSVYHIENAGGRIPLLYEKLEALDVYQEVEIPRELSWEI